MKKLKVLETKKVKLDTISTAIADGAFDVKADIKNNATVNMFVMQMGKGTYFPSIIVFVYNGKIIILDGRTRYEAHRRLGHEFIECQFVEFTTWADMLSYALAANMPDGIAVPVPPTMKDYTKIVRSFLKMGLNQSATTQRLVDAGVPEVFAAKVVKVTAHSKESLDKMHACEDIEQGRRTLDQCVTHYKLSKVIIEEACASRGYDLSVFSRDVVNRLNSIRKQYFRLADECSDQANKALDKVRDEIKTLNAWVTAQEAANS
jgi:hypothetical protein